MNEADNDLEFIELLEYLKASRRFDFSGYKPASLRRRITKRLQTLEIESYSTYIDYLEVHPNEFQVLFNTILINVTAFFRDRDTWDYLKTNVIPKILADKHAGESIRVWSAGCASGEETYTLAILLAEFLGIEQFKQRVKIFGTDLDENALTQARQAIYPEKDVKGLPSEYLEKYFEPVGVQYGFNKEMRRSVIFGCHNLMQDAPIAKVDLLLCRNTLMYFNSEAQNRILSRFHFALNPGGFMLLGKAEMLFSRTNSLFAPVDLKKRIFSKIPKAGYQIGSFFGAAPIEPEELDVERSQQIKLTELAYHLNPVAQMLVDSKGSLVIANDSACVLFNLKVWDFGRPLQELEVSYRPTELRPHIDKAYEERREVVLHNIEGLPLGGQQRYFEIRIIPLQENGDVLAVNIFFTNVTLYKNLQDDLQNSNAELEAAYEELQATNEELETTNEELQSANEELETTNEELHSTNEELETMNEELQSTNEELHSTNEQLNQINLLLQSILTSVHLGIVVLDRNLNIQVWNTKSSDMWGLRSDEVYGTDFINLDIGLPLEKVTPLIRQCLNQEANYQSIILDAINRRGKNIRCKIDAIRMNENRMGIEGVILLMEEMLVVDSWQLTVDS